MKVNYIYCDLCSKELNEVYGSIRLTTAPNGMEDVTRFAVRYDEVCVNCMTRLYQIIKMYWKHEGETQKI